MKFTGIALLCVGIAFGGPAILALADEWKIGNPSTGERFAVNSDIGGSGYAPLLSASYTAKVIQGGMTLQSKGGMSSPWTYQWATTVEVPSGGWPEGSATFEIWRAQDSQVAVSYRARRGVWWGIADPQFASLFLSSQRGRFRVGWMLSTHA